MTKHYYYYYCLLPVSIYSYIHATNHHVFMVHNVAEMLWLQYTVHVILYYFP